jgi:hypothetical protein
MENTSCYIFAFATFGHPNDFRQTPFKYNNPDVGKQIKVFDLSNAIKVFPNSTIYSIRKERIGNSKLISYSIYTFAQEQASKRDGTFIGSSIILENKLAEEKYVIDCLNEFHQKLTENNLVNGVLKVNHSKDFISNGTLTDFDKIKNPQIEILDLNFNLNNNSLVVYCDTSPNKLELFFKNSIDLLNVYDTIYFTKSNEVAEFVIQKGIFKLIQNVEDRKEFEKEINNLIDERKRKREQSISDFEREFQRINDDKNRTIQEFKTQLEQNERTHLANEKNLKDSKDDINKIGQFYDDFSGKTKSLINQLRHNNGKLEDVNQIHNSNKMLFNTGVSDLKRPAYVTNIPKAKPKGNLVIENQNQRFESKSNGSQNVNDEKKKKNKIDVFKVATLILSFLLIFTLVYFLFIKSDKVVEPIPNQEQQSSAPNEVLSIQTTIIELEELNPKSNAELNENDYQIIAKQLNYNTKIEDVVKTIYDKNPTDIKNNYTGQEENYGKHLIELNKNCFEENNGVYYFSRDTLLHIPSYKK